VDAFVGRLVARVPTPANENTVTSSEKRPDPDLA